MKLVLVRTSEWEGVYVNGILVTEDHMIPAAQLIEIINAHSLFDEASIQWLDSKQTEWLDETGNLPEKLEEIPTCDG